MTHETLNHPQEQSLLESFNKQQNTIIEKVRTFQDGRSGDIYFGRMKIYREPQAIRLQMRDEDAVISLDQARCETNDLGVNSRITLTHEITTEHGRAKTTYRSNESRGVKEYVNGQKPIVEEMTVEDFEKANSLLSKIYLSVKLL